MRRRTLLVALAGLAVVVAAGTVALWPRAEPNRITQENCDRIKEGMSRAEVEAILGPPGDYRTGLGESRVGEVVYGNYGNVVWVPDAATDPAPTLWNWSRSPVQWTGDPVLQAGWLGDSFWISIAIDESGSVVNKLSCPRRTTRGQLDNLFWRLKRQWHRWFPE
jgi:hypothetical protein